MNKQNFYHSRLKAFTIHEISAEPNFPANSPIDKLLQKYENLFGENEGVLSTANVPPMVIDTGDSPPIKQKAYRVPLNKRKIIDKEIENMLKLGVIEPSSSCWASPVHIVPKKDGGTRFCIDFRKINNITVTETTVLPTPEEIFDDLNGATIFTTLDLLSAYWQASLDKKSRKKTAFITHRGLFQFNRVCFGLKNAPAYFQRMMNKVLSKFIGKFCYVYIDDLVIYSRSEEEHLNHVEQVLQALAEAKLKLKKSKCSWFQSTITLLGFQISKEGVQSNPEKVEAIRNLTPPRNIKGVRSFLGTVNYFRKLIKNYADIAAPLNILLKKNQKWKWGEDQQKSFDELKSALSNAPVLAFPNPNKPYALYTDASDLALGAVLTQRDNNNNERPIAFISKAFTDAQKRWCTLERESFAILYSLDKLKTYLRGADFEIFTDNKPCVSLTKGAVKNAKLERWAVTIASYGGKITHLPGKKNLLADFLSRFPTGVLKKGEDEEIENRGEDRNGHEIANSKGKIEYFNANTRSFLSSTGKNSNIGSLSFENDFGDSKNRKLSNNTVAYLHNDSFKVYEHTDKMDNVLNDRIPWSYDDLNRDEVIEEQKKMPEYTLGSFRVCVWFALRSCLHIIKFTSCVPSRFTV